MTLVFLLYSIFLFLYISRAVSVQLVGLSTAKFPSPHHNPSNAMSPHKREECDDDKNDYCPTGYRCDTEACPCGKRPMEEGLLSVLFLYVCMSDNPTYLSYFLSFLRGSMYYIGCECGTLKDPGLCFNPNSLDSAAASESSNLNNPPLRGHRRTVSYNHHNPGKPSMSTPKEDRASSARDSDVPLVTVDSNTGVVTLIQTLNASLYGNVAAATHPYLYMHTNVHTYTLPISVVASHHSSFCSYVSIIYVRLYSQWERLRPSLTHPLPLLSWPSPAPLRLSLVLTPSKPTWTYERKNNTRGCRAYRRGQGGYWVVRRGAELFEWVPMGHQKVSFSSSPSYTSTYAYTLNEK